jgi:anaerobic ribonucleoside-triphosphate reductase
VTCAITEAMTIAITKGDSMNGLSRQVFLAPQKIVLTDEERQPCEIWTRVMGYHRPLSSFNTGKKGEFHERQYFTEQTAALQG